MARTYPAKLLLFGEYTVLHGSQALAVPLTRYGGRWERSADPVGPDPDFIRYVGWLGQEGIVPSEAAIRMEQEHLDGWRFVSDIPMGFGLGSSGAYVAAMFDRYMASSYVGSPMEGMARMESYFHGASSGLDPLVAYSRQAAYKDENGIYHLVDDPGWPQGLHGYLFDSGQSRTTAPLVAAYRASLENPGFRDTIERELRPMVEMAIHAYLQGAPGLLWQAIQAVSEMQRIYFKAMIPGDVARMWDALATNDHVRMKLCGAGGGGFFLVLADRPLDDGNLIPLQAPQAGNLQALQDG